MGDLVLFAAFFFVTPYVVAFAISPLVLVWILIAQYTRWRWMYPSFVDQINREDARK